MVENERIHDPENRTGIIIVTRRDGTKHAVLVDEDLFFAMRDIHIYVSPTRHKRNEFYARTYIDGKQYQLHRLILEGFMDEQYPEVDHIDPYQTLDNRRRNLRPANRKMQRLNLKKHREITTEQ